MARAKKERTGSAENTKFDAKRVDRLEKLWQERPIPSDAPAERKHDMAAIFKAASEYKRKGITSKLFGLVTEAIETQNGALATLINACKVADNPLQCTITAEAFGKMWPTLSKYVFIGVEKTAYKAICGEDRISIKSITNLAVWLKEMADNGMICGNWQYVVGEVGMFGVTTMQLKTGLRNAKQSEYTYQHQANKQQAGATARLKKAHFEQMKIKATSLLK